MDASSRVAVNTAAQYIRAILSVIISLYTSRLILANLGVDDYGISSLVGGVVAMLSFIQNNLSRTIHRFLSYHQGKDEKGKIVGIFNNSVWTQFIISSTLCLFLIILMPIVFKNLLNITQDRLEAAKIVYILTVINLFFNMLTTPYMAALISHENIVFSSIVSIVDSLLKIPIALSLVWISSHKLEWFSFMGSLIVVMNYLVYRYYSKHKYDECCHFSIKSFDVLMFKEMLSFMGWNVYGTLCITVRTQGIAILLNRFFTTAINAAYGLASQVAGQFNFLSSSLTTAMNPQIIKAEGSGNRKKMIRLSEISCKLSFLLMSIVSIPAVFFMDVILDVWLKDVPDYAGLFCSFILLSVQVDLITQNLSTSNQAVGNVKVYNIVINTIKAITIPFAYFVLKVGYGPLGVMVTYIIFESLCALGRLLFLHYNIQLSIRQYFINVILSVIPPLAINILICYFVSFKQNPWMFLLAVILSCITTCFVSYFVSLKSDEKDIVNGMLGKVIGTIKKR